MPFKAVPIPIIQKTTAPESVCLLPAEGRGEPELFLDPNTFFADGTTSLGEIGFSKDGSMVAYTISEGGSDWRKVITMNAITKLIWVNTLVDVKFTSIAWQGNDAFITRHIDKPKGTSSCNALITISCIIIKSNKTIR